MENNLIQHAKKVISRLGAAAQYGQYSRASAQPVGKHTGDQQTASSGSLFDKYLNARKPISNTSVVDVGYEHGSPLCVCFLTCLALCSCNAAGTRSISSYNWSLESISGMDGEILFSGSEHDGVEALDMALSFDKNGFTLIATITLQTDEYILSFIGNE